MRLTSCRSNHQARRRTWLTAGNVVAIFTATAVALAAAGLTASPAHAAAAADTHVVVRGESLWRIAAAPLPRRASDAQTATIVTRIAALNADDLPRGPHHLVAGQRLRMPGTASSRVR